MKYIVSALVSNKSGVLTRISGMFARRGYNIESLTVCSTENAEFSRMTIVVNGDEYILDQISKQLDKQFEVKKVIQIEPSSSVLRELLIIKVEAPAAARSQIMEIADVYKAKIIDLSPRSVILELTGEPDKIDGFIEVIREYGIIELARTGISALTRGASSIREYIEE